MRDINFRAWDSGGKMHYLGMEETDDALLFRSDQHFDGDLTVMQSTEEIDSKGEIIYEGDIVRYDKGDCVVEFEHAKFVLVEKNGEISDELHWVLNDLAIIGNIYEGVSDDALGNA